MLIPLVFFVLGIAGTLFLYLKIEGAEADRLRMETAITADQVRLRLESWIDARIGVASHLGGHDYLSEEGFRAEFAAHASKFISHYPDVQAFNFISPEGIVEVVIPLAENRAVLNADLHAHPNPGVSAALTRAEETDLTSRTPLIELLQGGTGFAAYVPIVRGEQKLGFVNAVFRTGPLLDAVLGDAGLRESFVFELADENGKVAYAHGKNDLPRIAKWVATLPVRVVDSNLILRLGPSPAHMAQQTSAADEVLAGTGFALVLGLSLLMRVLLLRQEALRRSQAMYRLLVENQNDMVVRLAADGEILYASPSFERTFGDEAGGQGSSFLRPLHPDDRALAKEALETASRPPHRADEELRSVTPRGIAVQAWSFSGLESDGGAAPTIIAVGRDITRRRELEEKLAAGRKMQAVGELAGGFAHDFNNLLQSMVGNLQFLEEDLRPRGQSAEDFDEVRRAVDKAMGLTSRLLAFGQRGRSVTESADLVEVVTTTLAKVQSGLPAAISLAIHHDGAALPVQINRDHIDLVIGNLCANAREAMPDGGRLTVGTELRQVRAGELPGPVDLPDGEYAALVVTDTGAGVAPEIADRVFEPFFSTRASSPSSGLGLAVCHGVVMRHGGAIFLESPDEAGATFVVLLPIERADETAPVPRPVAAGRGQETILLAEDDVSVRELAERVLKRAEYEVLAVADGQEAIDTFTRRTDDIDLVLLDLVMPNVDGRQARDAIKAIRPDVPVIFASGYDPATVNEFGGTSDEDVLTKPYGIPDLLAAVRRQLDRAPGAGTS